jgi:(p)ppGpp synthase/HD superfamily hydrolase
VLTIAKEHMTPEGYELLESLLAELPDCMDRPVSSSGKYHQRDDGSVPTIRQHTKEMLVHGLKVARMLSNTTVDELCFAIILHDALKYGWENGKYTITGKHVKKDHGELVADFLLEREVLSKAVINNHKVEKALTFHSGKWSSVFKNPLFISCDMENTGELSILLHTLDMLSANNCLKEVE